MPLSEPVINSTVDEDFIHYRMDLKNVTWRGVDHGVEVWSTKKSDLEQNVIDETLWNETE